MSTDIARRNSPPVADKSVAGRVNLLDLTLDELTRFIQELGQPAFRARQLWKWIWAKGEKDFSRMSDLALSLRAALEESACVSRPEVLVKQESCDGTVKFLLRLADGGTVESVIIPSESRQGKERLTLCLSCQVGCGMGCTFCSTGGMGFTRNMTMGEILGQVLVAGDYLRNIPGGQPLRNLVFMGMGEPLLNLSEVLRSLETLNSASGLSFSPRRITVSTCGMRQGLKELGESGLCYLAVSLHAPNQALREKIMPKAARGLPLDDLLTVLRNYPLRARERLTFEYLLLGGVNDSAAEAAELAKIMSRIKGKLNLILYNPVPGSPYKAPDTETAQAFAHYLQNKNITATLRKSKGQDIMAACGQLRSAEKS
ncbi:MAG: 23S rRNA (adenine(2503)-C(2))-methyltransferase RlmN [Desulfovibrio sp.]|jgi:23S rRNA (adenine2503-C2)-methyltransferase|nr:23S rRNA (adenine(2503)-C(2))-methyltransferase RlmN [Desulfovibrio sp.]